MIGSSHAVKGGGRPRRQTVPADLLQSIAKQPAQPYRRPRPYFAPLATGRAAPGCRCPHFHNRR
jgi:hypothetical protein